MVVGHRLPAASLSASVSRVRAHALEREHEAAAGDVGARTIERMGVRIGQASGRASSPNQVPRRGAGIHSDRELS